MKNNSFSGDNKYKLYRKVYDIIHPSISKKNISNYSIIIENKITPIKVFYPNKLLKDTPIILFVPSSKDTYVDEIDYSNICKNIANNCNCMILGIDYNSSSKNKHPNGLNECYETIKYLYKELRDNNIKAKNIILMGDSIGANIINGIIEKSIKDKFNIKRSILINPIVDKIDDIEKNKINVIQLNKLDKFLKNYINEEDTKYLFPINMEDYTKYPNTLLFIGAADPLNEKINKFYEKLKEKDVDIESTKITFADHNILGNDDPDIQEELYKKMNEFLNI